jgi:hypothetical protein
MSLLLALGYHAQSDPVTSMQVRAQTVCSYFRLVFILVPMTSQHAMFPPSSKGTARALNTTPATLKDLYFALLLHPTSWREGGCIVSISLQHPLCSFTIKWLQLCNILHSSMYALKCLGAALLPSPAHPPDTLRKTLAWGSFSSPSLEPLLGYDTFCC